MNRRRNFRVENWNVSPRAVVSRKAIIRGCKETYVNAIFFGVYSYTNGLRSFVEAAGIGKFCSIARQTAIGPSNHDLHAVSTHPFWLSPAHGPLVTTDRNLPQRPAPFIGNEVRIGVNSDILRGVTIGDGAVVAANSVVTKDVSPYSVVGCSPTGLIRYRFDAEGIAALQQIRWWDWSEDKLRSHASAFGDVAEFVRRFGW